MAGVSAIGVVKRAPLKTVRVSVPVRSTDGRYEIVAQAILVLLEDEPIPAFVPNGEATAETVSIEAKAEVEEPLPPMKLVLNSHTVCRGPDGKIKWEADTVPQELPLGIFELNGLPPLFQLGTDQIKSGKEHF